MYNTFDAQPFWLFALGLEVALAAFCLVFGGDKAIFGD